MYLDKHTLTKLWRDLVPIPDCATLQSRSLARSLTRLSEAFRNMRYRNGSVNIKLNNSSTSSKT